MNKFFLIFVCFLAVIPCQAKTIYVDNDATGLNNGTSWENAYKYLQDALDDANSSSKPVEIYVAQGIYRPDEDTLHPDGTGDREATFQLVNCVNLIGGYAGLGQPNPNERNIKLYETILSGDLAGNDVDVNDPCDLLTEPSRAENSYHLVVAGIGPDIGADANAVLDGFTITAGNANGEDYPTNQSSGGGIHIGWFLIPTEQGPTLTNCKFTRNSAINGGGMFNDHSETTLTNCTFSENFAIWGGGIGDDGHPWPTLVNCTLNNNCASYKGGAIANGESHAALENCTLIANRAQLGGAIYNGEAGTTLTNCTVIGNSAERGGVVFNSDGDVIMTNCIVSDNSCAEQGGVIYSGYIVRLTNCVLSANSARQGGVLYIGGDDSYAKLTNCTLNGNQAANNGGAIYFLGVPDSAIVTNCILWSNTPQQIYPELLDSKIVITYNDVQGGWTGVGNIDADPCFADTNNEDYHLKSQGGRWDANEGRWTTDEVTSLCIDAGDPMSPIGLEPFPNGGIINMGAFGGTVEASKSYFGKPTCQTIVAGDINGDCKIDFKDFAIMSLHWLECSDDLCLPDQASNPNPSDGATNIATDTALSWTAGSDTISHDVYFGTQSTGTFQRNQTETTFIPGTLRGQTKYYWRIDEVNSNGKTIGTVWSFTTGFKLICFPGDTIVWVNGSPVKISEVMPGRKVTAAAMPLGKAQSFCEVEVIQEHQGTFECYDVLLENGESLSVADNHYFLLDSGSWSSLHELTPGLKLQSLNGPIAVKCVVKRVMPFVGKVYNLKIKDSDRYFVGTDAVIVRDY